MDHVELTPYPFPDGMHIPRLMAFQEYPWNGDGYLAAEVLRLKAAHGIRCANETGTCLGSTTCWLAENFDKVNTCDVNGEFLDIAMARINKRDTVGRVNISHASSVDILNNHAPDGLYFLDAHWGPHCPLLRELDAIATANVKPCIIIHDFQVPGTDFGFDRFPDNGNPFCLEAIAPHLDAIYGTGGWGHRFPTVVEGAKRGWISIFPK